MAEEIKKIINAIGMNMPKARRDALFYGRAPKGTYPPHTDLAHIHDMVMSDSQKRRLYAIGRKTEVESTGEFVSTRLETDSKRDLITEMCENSSMTRTEATRVVEKWLALNHLVEKQTPFGKVIVSEEK